MIVHIDRNPIRPPSASFSKLIHLMRIIRAPTGNSAPLGQLSSIPAVWTVEVHVKLRKSIVPGVEFLLSIAA